MSNELLALELKQSALSQRTRLPLFSSLDSPQNVRAMEVCSSVQAISFSLFTTFTAMDILSLTSIKQTSQANLSNTSRLDIIVANAGVIDSLQARSSMGTRCSSGSGTSDAPFC